MIEPPTETGAEGVGARPRATGLRGFDLAIAFSAIAISLVSLLVAMENGLTERKLVAASSWPFLVATVQQNGLEAGSRTLVLSVTNNGVGPARIQSARVLLDGKPMHNRQELLRVCCGFAGGDIDAQIRDGLRSQNPIQGVLAPRDSVMWLAIQQTPSNAAQWQRLVATRLVLSACYCSVLNDCWTTDLTPTATPRPIGRCNGGKDDYWD